MSYKSSLLKISGYALISIAATAGIIRVAKVRKAKADIASTFVFCSDSSYRYVHDTRTFGIWYNRGRFDSALHFPLLTDTITCASQTSPQIFSIGPDNLWWFDGSRNYPIGGGGGGGLTGAENGLSVLSTDAILGYAGALPNLFRSVYTKTGKATWGVNVDSLFGNGAADTVAGPFVGVGNQSVFTNGPFWEAGYNNPRTNTTAEIDSTGFYVNGNFPDGNNWSFQIADNLANFILDAGDAWGYFGTETPQSWSVYSAGGIRLENDVGFLPTTVWNGTILSTDGTNGTLTDQLNTFSVRHIGAYMDSVLAIGGGLSAIFNSDLNVTTPSGYSFHGEDASFTLTFTTGVVTAANTGDSVIVRISLVTPSESSYSVVFSATGNRASGTALTTVQPFTTIQDQQTFNLCGAITPVISASFLSHTTYSIAFHIIDHTN